MIRKQEIIRVVGCAMLVFLVSALFAACFRREIAVENVTLDKTEATMEIGETLQLTASVAPEDATDRAVVWTSDQKTVATVSESGLISAAAAGTAKITATAGGKSATCVVTVSAPFDLSVYKTELKEELENYRSSEQFDAENTEKRNSAIEAGKTMIDEAETKEAADSALAAAKAELDKIPAIEATVSVDAANGFVVGKQQEFSITTTVSNAKDVWAVGGGEFSDPDAVYKFEYYEVQDGTWYEIPVGQDFGPSSGFPLTNATSKFRVTFCKAGEFDFTVRIADAKDKQIVYAQASQKISVSGSAVKDVAALRAAVADAKGGDAVFIDAGTYTFDEVLYIDTDCISIVGLGDVNITRGDEWKSDAKGMTSLITVVADNVTLENLTVTGAKHIDTNYAHGVNVYGSKGVTLKNIASYGNDGVGVMVVASSVTLCGVKTNDNGWGGVNIDTGNLDLSNETSLTVDETCAFAEDFQIYCDSVEMSEKITFNLPSDYKKETREDSQNKVRVVYAKKVENGGTTPPDTESGGTH